MIISAVLAVSENNVIGSDNSLPWRLSNDLKWFKSKTLGKPMIMGRKTFESLPGLLPGRTSIILTRDTDYSVDGAIVAHDMDQALTLAEQDAKKKGGDEITIVGGGEIYKLFADRIDRYYLTLVHTNITGDTYFSPLNEQDWQTIFSEFHVKSEKNDHDHTFFIKERRLQPI
ncbi:dihydrofolate reductase [Sneathiella aquimaris]|uniref:dihydrofolate reductase n=1 Tax=Sneathiella aquimaris TaxID=2599305 RepID=UPI0015E1ACF3|nr:dihydrofolate reductase [Sneathiella aquimaris]